MRKLYNKKREVKLRRVQKHNDNMKEMIQKQKLDEIRGSTYSCGIALKELAPSAAEIKDTEKKEKLGVKCNLPGCYEKGHKLIRSKKCKYNYCKDWENLHEEVDKEMRLLYPEDFGVSIYMVLEGNSSSMETKE